MNIFSLVLPCFNEGENIDKLLDVVTKLKKTSDDLEVVIVENGSTDNSIIRIKNHQAYKKDYITLVEVEKNLGYGHGIMAGLNKSSGKYIGWCHADLQNNIEDIYNIFKEKFSELEKENTVLKGRRMNRGIIDIFFTNGMSFFVNILFKSKFTDINAQPKIFHRDFLKLLSDPPIDFSLDLYILLTAKINNYKIIEHPLIVHKRIAGQAKGGGTIFTKIKLTSRTLSYIYKIKKSGKF